MHSSIVNATASYVDDIGRFCTSTDARVAGHIVVTPISAMQDAPSGSQALTCTAEQLYLNMQASGAAAWVTFCDHYNISAGAFFRLRGNYPPHSAQYSMAFFDAGTQIDQELLQSIRSGKDRMGERIVVQLALRTRQGRPPLAVLLEAPWCRLLIHWLPSIVYMSSAILAGYFCWQRYSAEGVKMPAIVLALEAAFCPVLSVTQGCFSDNGTLAGVVMIFWDNSILVTNIISGTGLSIILSFSIAFYLAAARQKAVPDYVVPRLKSNQSFSSEDLSQRCLGRNVFYTSTFIGLAVVIFLIFWAHDQYLVVAFLVLLQVVGNTLCVYYACRVWAILNEMEKDTRRNLARIVQWSWVSVLSCIINSLAASIYTNGSEYVFGGDSSLSQDILFVIICCAMIYSSMSLHVAQVCVWGWPYERDLEREVRDLTVVMQLFVHATALVSPDFMLEGDAGFEETFGQRTVELQKLCSSALDVDVALVAIQNVIRSGRAQKVQLQLMSQLKPESMRCTVGAVSVNGRVHLSFVVEARGYVPLDA